jgi:hypothetical protein
MSLPELTGGLLHTQLKLLLAQTQQSFAEFLL